MRPPIIIIAFIGAFVAASAVVTSATDSDEENYIPKRGGETVSYELTQDDGSVKVHEVNKKLVEIERKRLKTLDLLTRLLDRVLEIRQELIRELDDATREALMEELSVKIAALRELFRMRGSGALEQALEYLTVDVGLDAALLVICLVKLLSSFFRSQ